jgi:hypothetical protein
MMKLGKQLPKTDSGLPIEVIVRDVNEAARDVARALAKTEAFAQSRRDRKKVEMLFAHLKRILRLGRLRLRGPSGAQFEFTLAATAQNLRRLARLVARPPPIASIAVSVAFNSKCQGCADGVRSGAAEPLLCAVLAETMALPRPLKILGTAHKPSNRLLQQNRPGADIV